MPPKARFTEEEIIAAALEIVRQEGFSALTARSLGSKLESSARPIFTVFEGMEDVQQEVVKAARRLYCEYIDRGLAEDPPFKGVGTQYILFSIKEPKLFQLLFMREQKVVPMLSEVLPLIDENYEKILSSISADKSLAEKLYKHLWVYSHGIAALCATGMCRFTPDEIGTMMSEVYLGLLMKLKGELL